MWGWTRWVGLSSGALLIEQRVMPLFKKKDPKEQVSRPWATWMERWPSVTVHVSHLLVTSSESGSPG